MEKKTYALHNATKLKGEFRRRKRNKQRIGRRESDRHSSSDGTLNELECIDVAAVNIRLKCR